MELLHMELLHMDGPTQEQQQQQQAAAQQAQPAAGAANGLAGASSYELAGAFMADDAEASGRKRQRVGEAEAAPQYVASGAAFMADGLDTLQEDPLGLLGAAEPGGGPAGLACLWCTAAVARPVMCTCWHVHTTYGSMALRLL
jgi:hypothetical protein